MIIVPLAYLEKYHSLQIFLDELEPTVTHKALYAMLEQQRIEGDIAREQIALLSGKISSVSATPQLRKTQSLIPDKCWQSIQRGIFSQLYKRRALLMSPFDMANYTQLLGSLRPRTVFEIGTHEGGRSIWLADSLNALGIDVKIITIDINAHAQFEHPNIEALEGNALDLSDILTADKMAHLSRPFLVIEDSAHTFATSHAVLEFFNRYLITGDYIVIEDGNVGQLIGESEMSAPVQAINAFLGKHGKEYEIDFSICDRFGYNTTANSNGWIKRL
jgi:cephalosporin hydroxylase